MGLFPKSATVLSSGVAQLIFLVKTMRTYNGRKIYTASMAQVVGSVTGAERALGITAEDHTHLKMVTQFKETLLHKSVVIANEAGVLRRERGWKVTTVKGCNKKNLYAYIEGTDGVYVILETPATVLTPRDRAKFQERPDAELLNLIEAIRIHCFNLETQVAPVAEDDEPQSITASGPAIHEPSAPTGFWTKVLSWFTGR